MTSIGVYTRERVAELRSRCSALRDTLTELEQSCWSVFESCYSKGHTPPFLFPASSFKRLGFMLGQLQHKIENFQADASPFEIAFRLEKMHTNSRILLCEINRLQDLLVHRCAGINKFKTFEHHQISEFEYSILSKTYNAVDALTFDLVERILGLTWMMDEKYVPLSVFDDRGYMVNPFSYITSIPYYDNFRSRFWTILAHEVSHIFVFYQTMSLGVLHNTMLAGQEKMVQELGFSEDYAALQITELTCDIISAYVCPTVLLAALQNNSMIIDVELSREDLIEQSLQASHPPSDSRLRAMGKVLEHTGIFEVDAEFKRIYQSAIMFYARKNLVISEQSHKFLENFNNFAEEFSENVISELSHIGVEKFGGDDWNIAIDSLGSKDAEDESPVHTTAIVWLKRLRKTKSSGNKTLRDFLLDRKNETKAFEYAVEQMYKYYETKIVPRVRVEPYDLWFSFN